MPANDPAIGGSPGGQHACGHAEITLRPCLCDAVVAIVCEGCGEVAFVVPRPDALCGRCVAIGGEQ